VTRIALIADIHSNNDALQAVLIAAKEEEVDFYLAVGDLVGYYFEPQKVIRSLQELPHQGVAGNHETMFLDALRLGRVPTTYGGLFAPGIQTCLDQLGPSEIAYLRGLPGQLAFEIDSVRIVVSHSLPWSPGTYPTAQVILESKEEIANLNCDWFVIGHTHSQLILDINGTKVLNPGSVGQPRGAVSGAKWALLDTLTGDCHFQTDDYDVSKILFSCESLGATGVRLGKNFLNPG